MEKDQTSKEIKNSDKEEESKSLKEKKDPTTKKPEDVVKELEEKITRNLAEMENQRRRYEKEKEDAFEYGGFAFAKECLNLIDNLERSKESIVNDENLKDKDAKKKIIEHLDIIYSDMLSIFKKNHIQAVKSLNEKLDPNLHQAMMEIEDNDKEPGTIVQEIQKGFMMKDRLLRPSLVGVSKKAYKNDKNNGN